MVLRRETVRTFHRTLYAGWNETIEFYKRDNVDRSVVTVHTLYDCRPGQNKKTGQPIYTQTTSDDILDWHIPRIELDRVGVTCINALDAIKDELGRWWQPESDTDILIKLGLQHICVWCKLTDPLVGPSVIG